MKARFPIVASIDRAKQGKGMVEIDRERDLFTVRQLRSRKRYTLPLAQVAEIVAARVVKMELAEKERTR